MKTGRNLNDFFQEVQRQQNAKRDFVANTNQLEIKVSQEPDDGQSALDQVIEATENNPAASRALHTMTPLAGATASGPARPDVCLDIDGQGQFAIKDTAHNQIAQWAKIPTRYYKRMLETEPQLLADNVNTWFNRSNARRMIRTMDRSHRAFLSDRYRVLDNVDILSAIMPVLGEVGLTNTDVISCEVTDRKLYFKCLFPKVQAEVKVGDVVQAGLVIQNSEIGLGGVQALPLIYRLECLNGMIRADYGLKKYHVGRLIGEGSEAIQFFKDDTLLADDTAFLKKLRDVVTAAAGEIQFNNLVEDMKEATERQVENPQAAISEVTKKFGLNDEDNAGLMSHFIQGGDISQWGIANALTRYSQDVDDYDKATDLERAGGQIIELSPKDWKTIETAKAA